MSKRTRPWITVLVLLLVVVVVVPTTLAQTLAPGSRGIAVAGLQRGLQALGYDPGPIDGVFGSRTGAAVRAFQRDAALKVDGIAGPVTLGALDGFLARSRAAHYTVQPGDTLYLISQRFHTTVAALQELNGLQGDALEAGQPLLIPVTPQTPALAPRPDHALVLGYYTGDTDAALRSLDRAAPDLDVVAAFAYRLDPDGSLDGAPFPGLMRWAQDRRKPVLALVHNAGDSGFLASDVAQLLSDPAAEDRAVENIYAALVAGGYAGVHLDLENVPPTLRDDYTAFVEKVADRLHPAGFLTTVAVPARTGDLEAWWDGYDYDALGRTCDYVAVMAYDQHSPDGLPGPVASLDWVQAVAKYAAQRIPTDRLLIGVAAYGYDWVEGVPGATAVAGAQAPGLAFGHGVSIAWSDSAQVPWFRYRDGLVPHIVYYENAYSLAPKLAAARQAGAGIALWRLGLEDPAIWDRVTAARAPLPSGAGGAGTGMVRR